MTTNCTLLHVYNIAYGDADVFGVVNLTSNDDATNNRPVGVRIRFCAPGYTIYLCRDLCEGTWYAVKQSDKSIYAAADAAGLDSVTDDVYADGFNPATDGYAKVIEAIVHAALDANLL